MRAAYRLAPVLACLMAAPAGATTLEDAIAAALKNAPAVAVADAERDAARGRVTQAKSGMIPHVTLEGDIGKGHIDPKDFFGLTPADVDPRVGKLSVQQTLYAGGRVSAGIAQAKAGLAAAEAGQTGTRGDVAAAVAAAYGNVLAAREGVELYRRLIAETAEIGRMARQRYKAGAAPNTDVAQAEARQAGAEAGLARAEGNLTAASAHYENLVGMKPDGLAPVPGNPALPATLDEAVAIATDHAPMVRQARAGLEAATAAKKAAKAEWLPTVGAYAEATTVRDQFFPGYKADSTGVGIRARWPIFSGGYASGAVSEKSAEARAAEARLRQAEQGIQEQVISAWAGVRATLLAEQAAEKQVRAAEEALASMRHEVRVGSRPQVDLLDAEREAIGAGTGLSAARTDRIAAAWQLRAILGQE